MLNRKAFIFSRKIMEMSCIKLCILVKSPVLCTPLPVYLQNLVSNSKCMAILEYVRIAEQSNRIHSILFIDSGIFSIDNMNETSRVIV